MEPGNPAGSDSRCEMRNMNMAREKDNSAAGRKKKQAELMIDAAGVVHEYSRRDVEGNVLEIIRAVDGMDMQVKAGEFVGILGANGSGKSTFAKHINALLLPTEGSLYLDGKDTRSQENVLAIRQLAGMVFQNPDNQIISNVVEEDVAFGPENMGIAPEKILRRVEESLTSVGMYEYRKHSPNRLSGGQKQRVAIAGIMAMEPRCIILDEATAMLDPMGRKNVLDTVKRLNREMGITVVLITHYMEEVVEADRIFVMRQGKVAVSGTPREVFGKPEILAACHVELPDITKIALGLKKAGMDIPGDVLTEQELLSYVSGNAGKGPR